MAKTVQAKKESLKSLYANAKKAKVGETCKCPSCKAKFIKRSYQQIFCKNKPGTQCKDFYWNNVTETKRNNTTRISPASAAFLKEKKKERNTNNEPDFTIE